MPSGAFGRCSRSGRRTSWPNVVMAAPLRLYLHRPGRQRGSARPRSFAGSATGTSTSSARGCSTGAPAASSVASTPRGCSTSGNGFLPLASRSSPSGGVSTASSATRRHMAGSNRGGARDKHLWQWEANAPAAGPSCVAVSSSGCWLDGWPHATGPWWSSGSISPRSRGSLHPSRGVGAAPPRVRNVTRWPPASCAEPSWRRSSRAEEKS